MFSTCALIPLCLVLAALDPLGPGDSKQTLTVNDQERSYVVHVPKSYDGEKAVPAVLVFHGGGSNAEQWQKFCGLDETAEKEGFIAVYPNGMGKVIEGYGGVFTWNGGTRQPGANNPELNKVDDVAFVRALLDDLAKRLKIDPKRVYAAGMSMGAIMSYRLASDLSDRIAAVATIAGPMATETCHPTRPVPLIHFHGTDDNAVPFAGGKGKIDPSGTDFLSVEHSIQSWIKANGCDETPVVDDLPDRADDGTKVVRKTYGGGKNGAEVVLVVIEGGGHTWPGKEFGPELKIAGKSTHDISANALIWEFFQKHPMS